MCPQRLGGCDTNYPSHTPALHSQDRRPRFRFPSIGRPLEGEPPRLFSDKAGTADGTILEEDWLSRNTIAAVSHPIRKWAACHEAINILAMMATVSPAAADTSTRLLARP